MRPAVFAATRLGQVGVAHNRQLGGGPALAAWTYSITKGTCYGALVVGGTADVITYTLNIVYTLHN